MKTSLRHTLTTHVFALLNCAEQYKTEPKYLRYLRRADYGLWQEESVGAGWSTKAQLWFPGLPCVPTGVYPGQASLPVKHLQMQLLHPSVSPVNTSKGSVLQRQSLTPLRWWELSTSGKPSCRSAHKSSGLFGNTKFSLHWLCIKQATLQSVKQIKTKQTTWEPPS